MRCDKVGNEKIIIILLYEYKVMGEADTAVT